MLVSADLLQQSCNRYYAPSVETAKAAVLPTLNIPAPVAAPESTGPNLIGTRENLIKRKEMIAEMGQEPTDFAFERAIGKNDSVYSNFIELIALAKRKVGRVVVRKGIKNTGFATGFMVSDRLLLTNWHVFPTIREAVDSEVQFYYELDTRGNPISPITFLLDTKTFYHASETLDYCLVAVNPVDINGSVRLASIGYIFLDPALGKLGNVNEEALNIIHHPEGDYKQLSIRENIFIRILTNTIWYKTDTAPGSSGSPVFNDQWQVVALHHMGVPKMNEKGEYLDKDDQVIPKTKDDKIDLSKVVWIANEGIRISMILQDVFTAFPNDNIVNGLKVAPLTPPVNALQLSGNIRSEQGSFQPAGDQITLSFPAGLLASGNAINVRVDQQSLQTGQTTQATPTSLPGNDSDISAAEELSLAQKLDFSACKGYNPDFLGKTVPIPQPKANLKNLLARIKNVDAFTLHYFNYSVFFRADRKMPALSIINVEGDPKKRLDKSGRDNNWLQDNRIDFSIQLDNNFYANSKFDRGHMSRREDADWGDTPEEAKRNAGLTFMFTNACPQVPKINQVKEKGLWGKLETVVLEKGASKEKEKSPTSKITVLNGPIFKSSDPTLKGVQIPLEFFKIILWLTDDGKLKATAFRLSQIGLVKGIVDEQLNLDQNVTFKTFQCSIQSLEDATDIDFSGIKGFDTFKGTSPAKEVSTTKALGDHIAAQNQ